jgi:glycosyltransferase involved in cell wall biosynthesis
MSVASPPTIAMVAPSLHILGGQAVQATLLAEQLRDAGYHVDYVPIDPPFPSGMGWLKRFPYLRTLANEGLYLPSLMGMRRTDIVHIYSASYWSFLLAPLPALLMAKRLRKPVVLNYHSGEAEDHLAHWGAWVHPWLKKANEIVVPSKYLQHVFASHGYRTRVIHNTVDVTRFRYRVRSPLRPRLLSSRNLERHYGVDQILIAFALLKTNVPHATLTIAGIGSQEEELRHLVQKLKLTDVNFLGRIEPAAMRSIYDEADVFLNASYIDNQPLSILEAMASGLPIVTTGVGDIPDMIQNGLFGTLVPVNDPAAMAKAVMALLEQPERAASMAHGAEQSLKRYSWSHVSAQWAQVYEELHQSSDIPRAA